VVKTFFAVRVVGLPERGIVDPVRGGVQSGLLPHRSNLCRVRFLFWVILSLPPLFDKIAPDLYGMPGKAGFAHFASNPSAREIPVFFIALLVLSTRLARLLPFMVNYPAP